MPVLQTEDIAIADFGDELVGNACYWSIPHRLSPTEDQQCQNILWLGSYSGLISNQIQI
jgi:hypothetical protein